MSAEEKKLTINEFKMWLQGVEEMQQPDWIPDARQWEKIRQKIDMIIDGPPQREVNMGQNLPPPGPIHREPPPQMPIGPSNLQPTPRVPQPPRVAHTASGLPVSMASGSPNTPARTPDIDTSNGNYDSHFV